MPLLAEIAALKAQIEYLEFARKDTTDTRIREVIEFRLEEQRLKLFQLESTQRSVSPQSPSPVGLRPRRSP
jgi:anti-sigma-K factor RskA